MTVLVDTSVWIDHFRRGRVDLVGLLERGVVLSHPFVIGELACGGLRRRAEILSLLDRLPAAPVASDAEARTLVERKQLWGRGLGWTDVNLLASCMLVGISLWTLDRHLADSAAALGLTHLR